jgi:hypothetical protein
MNPDSHPVSAKSAEVAETIVAKRLEMEAEAKVAEAESKRKSGGEMDLLSDTACPFSYSLSIDGDWNIGNAPNGAN